MTKTTKELIAGDVVKHIDGSTIEIRYIHPTTFDPTIFAVTFFNQTTQVEDFEYENANASFQIVNA